ncbi:MAG: flavin reductase family protein [Ruminococcus sp.]|nr:flavin reductase family protein [Ruminococcus sp.]
MNKISLPQASKRTSPNPVTLVCTQKPDGNTNLATVSWWTYLSYNPNMIAYAMAKTSYSGERVRETGKVILTIPSEEIADEVMKCGMSTGRNTDKVTEYGIALQDIPESDIKIPVHSTVAIKCSLKEFIETGDHYLYICNVEEVYADESKKSVFAWNGYSEIRSAN